MARPVKTMTTSASGWKMALLALMAGASLMGAASGQDVGGSLDDFWDGVSENANVTAPRADIGQEGGYFTGGSIVVRAPQDRLQPLRMTAPSIRAGCGGIDLFTGGFGFVDSEQLVAMMRAIASNATGYAFQLALETVCPQCAEQMDKLNALAQEINSQNISSCQAAQDMVNAVWPRHQNAQSLICSTTGTRTGQFSDWVSARHNCGSGGNPATEDAQAERNSITDTNIAWEALKQTPIFSSAGGREEAEFIMTLTGTLVIGAAQGDDGPSYQYIAPQANDEAVFEALLNGGSASILRCNTNDPDDRCLAPHPVNETIHPDDGLLVRTREVITSILDKISTRDEGGLSQSERNFLNMTSVPVYKILSVSYAYSGDNARLEIPRLSEYIAVDLMTVYLNAMVDEAYRGRAEVEFSQGTQDYIDWRQQVRHVQEQLNTLREEIAARHGYTDDVIASYRVIEQVLARRMEVRMARGLRSARGM
tara:strand:+ start:9455 stop:10894 length:1440 start_codon:yes stop_codon:yes gene_type:complete